MSQKDEGQTTRITRSNEYARCAFAPESHWTKNQAIGGKSPSPAQTIDHRKNECFTLFESSNGSLVRQLQPRIFREGLLSGGIRNRIGHRAVEL
jgi:hypothetical protein